MHRLRVGTISLRQSIIQHRDIPPLTTFGGQPGHMHSVCLFSREQQYWILIFPVEVHCVCAPNRLAQSRYQTLVIARSKLRAGRFVPKGKANDCLLPILAIRGCPVGQPFQGLPLFKPPPLLPDFSFFLPPPHPSFPSSDPTQLLQIFQPALQDFSFPSLHIPSSPPCKTRQALSPSCLLAKRTAQRKARKR